MWNCPKCKRSFRNTNQSHSCKPLLKEPITEKLPPGLEEIYKKINTTVKSFGKHRKEVLNNNTVFFKTKSTFLAVKIRKTFLEVEFYLDHKIDTPVVSKFLQTSKNRFAYVVPVDEPGDINHQLLHWLKFSYDLISK